MGLHRALLLAVALGVAGCSPAHAPLACDPARASEAAFVFQETAAFFSPYEPHGSVLLVVDGSCRYHTYSYWQAPGGVLRSGVLTADELAGLNADLLTRPWEIYDGLQVNYGTGADAPEIVLRRDVLEASCYSDCATHADLAELERLAREWATRLWGRGTPVDGPVEVHGRPSTTPTTRVPTPWAGANLAALLPGPAFGRARVEGAADVARLRELRAAAGSPPVGSPLQLEQAGVSYDVGVADPLPVDVFLHARGIPWH